MATLAVDAMGGRSGRRAEIRLPLTAAAELADAEGRVRSIRLQDLSRAGAGGEAAIPPAVGAPVTLRLGRLVVPGSVRWARGARFGLAFDAPIRAIDLLIQVSRHRLDGR